MGQLNDVRRLNGTAPLNLGAATEGHPAGPEAKADAKPGAATDRLSLTKRLDLAEPPTSVAEKGWMDSLWDRARSAWGWIFHSGSTESKAAGQARLDNPHKAEEAHPRKALDAHSLYKLKTEAKIQEAKDQALRQDYDADYERVLVREAISQRQLADENAKVPLTDEQQVVYGTLTNAAQKKAYKELSAEDRDKFDKAYIAVGGTWGEADKYAQKAASGIRNLLAPHDLLEKDSQGTRLLDTLASHATATIPERLKQQGLDTRGQLQNIVIALAYPDTVYQGKNTHTCVAASLQTVMAADEKAEYARIATDLIFEGQTKLQDGETVTLSLSELGHGDTRSTTSALIQGSLRDFAKHYPVDGHELPEALTADQGTGKYGKPGTQSGGRYGSAGTMGDGRYGKTGTKSGGAYGKPGTKGGGTYGAAGTAGSKEVPGGLTENQAQMLFEAVAGKLAVHVPVLADNRDQAWEGVVRSLDAGMPVPVGVVGTDDKGHKTGHQITLLRIEGDEVVYADSGQGHESRVKISQIRKDVTDLILPAQFADHTGWNIVANSENPGDANGDQGGGRYASSGTQP